MVTYISICLHREICPGLQANKMKIKRPLFIFALSVLVVVYAINTLPESMLYCSLALFVLFAVIHRFTTNRYTHHILLFMLAAIIGAGWFGVFKNNLNDKIKYLLQYEKIDVTAIVLKSENVGYANRYEIKLKTVNGENFNNFKVNVYLTDDIPVGDTVKMTGKYKGFTPKSNYMYSYSNGIYGYFYPDEIAPVDRNGSFTYVFDHIRTVLTNKSRKIFNEDSIPVAVAMGLGDKSLLTDSVKLNFNYTGISHTLVVSGLHVGFIVAVINALLYLLPVYKRVKNIVLCICVVMFMGIIGFTPSIIRAGCLLLAMTIGKTFIIETDNYNVLAVIILITLFINPYSAVNGSLLLSYTAYFGVIHAAQLARDRKFNKIKSSLLITVFAVLYTSPILAVLGMKMTLLSPVFNLLLSPIIMVICVLSFFLPVISLIPTAGEFIAGILAPVNNVFIRILMEFTEFVKNNFSFAMINISTEMMKVIVFATLISVVIAFIQFSKNRNRIIFSLTVPLIVVLCYNFMNREVITVKIFDGSSEPSYVISYKDENYLIATENINHSKFADAIDQLDIDSFDEIIVCSLKETDEELYSQFTEQLITINDTQNYSNKVFTIDTYLKNRQMTCVIDIAGVSFGFNHNKANLSDKNLDFYFFGSTTPADVNADNFYYFYPVIKKNIDLVSDKQAKELYDMLTIKIKNGNYSIMEDVKNFGSRI